MHLATMKHLLVTRDGPSLLEGHDCAVHRVPFNPKPANPHLRRRFYFDYTKNPSKIGDVVRTT